MGTLVVSLPSPPLTPICAQASPLSEKRWYIFTFPSLVFLAQLQLPSLVSVNGKEDENGVLLF